VVIQQHSLVAEMFTQDRALQPLNGVPQTASRGPRFGRAALPGSCPLYGGSTPSPVGLYAPVQAKQYSPEGEQEAEVVAPEFPSPVQSEAASTPVMGAPTLEDVEPVAGDDMAAVAPLPSAGRRTPLTPGTLSEALRELDAVCQENEELRNQLNELEESAAANAAAAEQHMAALRQESDAQLAYITELQAEAAQLRRQASGPAGGSSTPSTLASYVDDALKSSVESRREAASARTALLVAQAQTEAATRQRDEAQRSARQHLEASQAAEGRAQEAEALLKDALEVTAQLTAELDAVWAAREQEQEQMTAAGAEAGEHASSAPRAAELAALTAENDALRRRLVDAEAALRSIRTNVSASLGDGQANAAVLHKALAAATAALAAATERGDRYKQAAKDLARRLKALSAAQEAELRSVRERLRAAYVAAAASAEQPTPLGRDGTTAAIPASAVKVV
jgi:hypothetical protein